MFKVKRIRMKLFLAMVLSTALPLAITSVIILLQVNRQIENDQAFAAVRIKQDLGRQIEESTISLNETAYQIYSNPDLIESIALDKEFLSDSRTYDTYRDIHDYFLSVYNQSRVKNIMGMYLVRLDGEEVMGTFFPNYFPRISASYIHSLTGELAAHGYAPIMKARNESVYNEPIMQFLYPVRYRGQPTGLLVIDIREKAFRELVESYNTFYKGQIVLLDSDGSIIYETNYASRLKTGNRLAGQSDVSIRTELYDANYTLHYTYDIHPEQLFYRRIAYAMIGLSVALALGISLALSIGITNPIIQLHRNMARIHLGDYNARVEVRSEDEIGYLGLQFNRMAEKIQLLIEHDLKLRLANQESQIKALQAQISPHFLFNTLQMMAGIAEVNKVPDLKSICQSLGDMYRYNMNIGNEWVSLRNEIKHVRNYLVIINKRFPNRIRFRLDIEPEALDLHIPKLVLQPIIENAVEHGLTPSRRKSRLIKLSARIRQSEDCLYISVLDNGIGMDEAALESIDALFRDGQRIASQEEGSIGLYNVYTRIRLICGEPHGIGIKSGRGRGTWVIYRLPLKEDV